MRSHCRGIIKRQFGFAWFPQRPVQLKGSINRSIESICEGFNQRINPTGKCFAACYWNRKKKSYRLPTTKYRLKNEIFERSNVTILTYIHMISFEYEYFGSERTPETSSSTRHHTASLFCFIQDRSIPLSMQGLVSIKSSISQLTVFYFIIIARETIHDCSDTRERITSSLSLPRAVSSGWQPQHQSLARVRQMVPVTR